VILVDHESTTNGPGTAWANAYDNLEEALSEAASGDELWVADGTYYPTDRTKPSNPASVVFRVREGVWVFGGFQGLSRSGGGEDELGQRNAELYETILSGDIDQDEVYDNDNAENILLAEGDVIDDDARWNGFTIRDAWGRGIIIGQGAWPVFARCVITGCEGGAAIDNAVLETTLVPPEGPARFLACTFHDNYTIYHGGGAIVVSGDAEFINCLAYKNSCGNTGSFLFVAGETTTIVNCTAVDNQCGALTSNKGAALRCTAKTVDVRNCIFYGNTNGEGGGELAQIALPGASDLTVETSDIEGLSTFAGNNNFDADPLFVNVGNDDYRLQYLSPCLNNGDAGEMPSDSYDIDSDSDTSEALPDHQMANRQVNPSDCIDVGATENQVAGSCLGDITGGTNDEPDGDVGDPDLDLVLDAWGTPGGVVDVHPTPCGNGTVNVDDLLLIINNWGSCASFGAPSSPPSIGEIITQLQAFAVNHLEHEELIESIIVELLNNEPS